jgi:CRISPR/Cas system-associated endonuclease Cas1
LEEKKGPNGDAINAALSYIYTTLPQNAKTRLKIEAGGKESGILNLL